MIRLIAGAAALIYWIVCLANQTPEEYEEIRWAVEEEEKWI